MLLAMSEGFKGRTGSADGASSAVLGPLAVVGEDMADGLAVGLGGVGGVGGVGPPDRSAAAAFCLMAASLSWTLSGLSEGPGLSGMAGGQTGGGGGGGVRLHNNLVMCMCTDTRMHKYYTNTCSHAGTHTHTHTHAYTHTHTHTHAHTHTYIHTLTR